nr:hypothetical protein [Tanacetum cinerariifolium]
MADQHTMAELLRAPTEGYAEAIVVPLILAEQLKLKHSLINMMTSDQFFGLEKDNPHDHIPDQDSLNSAAGGNLLERRTQNVLTIIENKSNVRNSRNKSVVSQVKSSDANSNSSSEISKLTHALNQQTSVVTTAMTTILKQFQATPPPASVKAVEEIFVTCSGAHPSYQCFVTGGNTFPKLRDNIQGYVAAATVNYNQGNSVYHPSEQFYQALTQQNQVVPLSELEKVKRNNVKNELRNEMKNSIHASMTNQTNELKNMMASFFQMNTTSSSGSGSLPSNTIANPKGELKAITTQSGILLDGPSVPIPLPFINPEEDERIDETLTDQDLAEYTIKVPPPLQEKDEVQIHKFWQMFKQLHINITLADALILIPKYQKMLKALISNKERLLELVNTPFNENCSAVILKKLPEKLGDPGKFLISCGFNELKCKALDNLGASINLMPLSVWKKLGLPELIFTRMTLELANRAICTPARIARDVFVSVGKFTFPANFVIVDYESDPSVPLILGRPFLRTARALIDVHGEEMILRDGDERFTLNMRHDTSSDNLTFSFHPELTSPEVKDDIFDPEGGNVLPDKLLDLDSTKDLHPPHHFDIESNLNEIEYLLHHDPIKDIDSILKDSIDQINLVDLNNNLVHSMPEMFIDEHALDYSSPPLYDEYDDDIFKVESDTENVYDDPFDSNGEKIKEFKLLIDELDLPCDFLLPSEYDSFFSKDFSKVDALPLTNNKDKLAISHASLMLEDFDPSLYELPFFKEVP